MKVSPVLEDVEAQSSATLYPWVKRAAWTSIPVSIVLVVALALQTSKDSVFESPELLFVTNTLFISIASFVVAFITARAYLQSGILRLLIVGSAALLFGLNSLVSGYLFYLPDGPNAAITAYNIAALVAGLLHFLVAWLFGTRVILADTRRRLARVAFAYVGVVIFSAVVILISSIDVFPRFFIQGTGSTPIRQVVLGGAILSFAIAAMLMYLFHLRSDVEFHFWYALALALTAIGLAGVFFQSASGSWLNWTGRFAQQLGGLYLGISVLTIMRAHQLKGIALEIQVADLFRDAEANYQALVETVPDAIVAVDQADRVILWNSAAAQMFGYSSSEASGASFARLVFPQTPPDAARQARERLFRTALDNPSGRITEATAVRKNGEHFPIEMAVSVRPTAGGSMSTLIIRDATERKRSEEALRATLQRVDALNRDLERRQTELEIANKELESFSYSVSHDLRSPLASIDGFAQVLEQDYASMLPEQAQRYLGLIRAGAHQMDQLIQSLLSLSRLSRQAPKKERVDMEAMIRQVVETVRQETDRPDVKVEIDRLPDAQADPVLLKQVWVNLVANAFKFTRERQDARIEIGCQSCDGEDRVYYVRDNGVGFDMEEADRLFGVFQRLHSEEEYEGTGIGLAIVQRIVRRHGGRVWAEGKVGEGATFYFTLG